MGSGGRAPSRVQRQVGESGGRKMKAYLLLMHLIMRALCTDFRYVDVKLYVNSTLSLNNNKGHRSKCNRQGNMDSGHCRLSLSVPGNDCDCSVHLVVSVVWMVKQSREILINIILFVILVSRVELQPMQVAHL